MTERTRKKIVYGALIVAVLWGAYNFSDRSAEPYRSEPAPTIQPAGGTAAAVRELDESEIARVRAAGWGRDPFGVLQQGRRVAGPSWNLRGIIYSASSPLAYINGSRVGIGDTINDATVVAITRTAVKLRYQGREFEIRVHKG